MKRTFPGSAAKAALRVDAMARRDAMGAKARDEGSAAIARSVVSLLETLKPGVVAVYRAIRTEVVPDPICDWVLANDLVLVLPAVIDDTRMVFRRYQPGDALDTGAFGTQAPTARAPEIDPDAVVLPLVSFDRAGIRLGHGRGYYDRAILNLDGRGARPHLIGIAFASQEVASIPRDVHDARMDWIVTEKETIDLRHLA